MNSIWVIFFLSLELARKRVHFASHFEVDVPANGLNRTQISTVLDINVSNFHILAWISFAAQELHRDRGRGSSPNVLEADFAKLNSRRLLIYQNQQIMLINIQVRVFIINIYGKFVSINKKMATHNVLVICIGSMGSTLDQSKQGFQHLAW